MGQCRENTLECRELRERRLALHGGEAELRRGCGELLECLDINGVLSLRRAQGERRLSARDGEPW